MIVTESKPGPPETQPHPTQPVSSARVSAAETKSKLESQTQRFLDSCAASGDQVAQGVKEIGSGINDPRPKLLNLLTDDSVSRIVVEPQDRLTRFGFNSLDRWLRRQGRASEVIHLANQGKEDLIQDVVAIVPSCGARR